MKKRQSKGKRSSVYMKLAAWLWFVFISILLLLPGNALPKTVFSEFLYFDKLVHVIFFGLLCYLMLRAFSEETNTSPWIMMATFLAYGVSIEFIQKDFIPNRSFDAIDIISDAIGIFIGYLFYRMKFLAKKQNIPVDPDIAPIDVMSPLKKKGQKL